MGVTIATIVGILLLAGLFYTLTGIDISTHKKMTTDKTKQWGYGNFETFKREFEKIEWEEVDIWEDSFFDYSTNSKIHASIFQFNGIGMVISRPTDYRKVMKFLDEKIKERLPKSKNKKGTYQW